jgi:hypothetical protein
MDGGNKKRKGAQTMSKREAIALSIVETLTDKSEGTGLPSGHMYAALMSLVGLSEYQGIIAGLQHVGLVDVSSDYVTATPKARAMMAQKVTTS